jgi:hypothetical protein
MNELRGPCSNCGALLAVDQRYCVECGTRVGAPLALPYPTSVLGAEQEGGKAAFALPIPIQMATTFAAMALGFGVVIGTAISPSLSGIIASSPPPVAEAPSTEEPAQTPPIVAGGGGGPPPSPASSAVAAAPVSSGTGTGGGGGGGGGKKKKKKKKKKKAETLGGIVVHVNPAAVSYSIGQVGNLKSIHTDSPGSLPAIGTDLSRIPVRSLRNGTFAETGQRTAQGSASSATFTGTVTYCADTTTPVNPSCGAPPAGDGGFVYSVSGVGSSVLVRVPGNAPESTPTVGQVVTTTVQINDFQGIGDPTPPGRPACTGDPAPPVFQPPDPSRQLLQSSLTPTGSPATGGTLEAVVEGLCPAPPELVLSADDVRESQRDLLPPAAAPGIDQTKLFVGQPVMVSFSLSGSKMTINGVGSDHGVGGADDPAQGYGSLTR